MGESDMGSSAPAQLLDSGLCGLSLVAGYYRIAGDPAQLRHQLALTGRSAQAEDIVRGANILQLKSRGFAVLGAGPTKGMVRLIDPIARTAQELSTEAVAALTSGDVVLITRR